jgi:hypothetical protein
MSRYVEHSHNVTVEIDGVVTKVGEIRWTPDEMAERPFEFDPHDGMFRMYTWLRNHISPNEVDFEFDPREDDWDDLPQILEEHFGEPGHALPVFTYIHSGIAYSTGSFSCRFDSGRAGVVCMKASDVPDGADPDEMLSGAVAAWGSWANGENLYADLYTVRGMDVGESMSYRDTDGLRAACADGGDMFDGCALDAIVRVELTHQLSQSTYDFARTVADALEPEDCRSLPGVRAHYVSQVADAVQHLEYVAPGAAVAALLSAINDDEWCAYSDFIDACAAYIVGTFDKDTLKFVEA